MRPAAAFLILAAIACLLCQAALAQGGAPASEQQTQQPQLVLPLPANADAVCLKPAFHDLTDQFESCAMAFLEGDNPDEECCQGMAAFYGPNSTLPSRNCFCVKSVWTTFSSYQQQTYYNFKKAFQMCANMGYIIPYYDEDKNGTATGYCYGIPPSAKTLASALVKDRIGPDHVSSAEWFQKLHVDDLITLSFATGIMSGVGSLVLVWFFMWDVIMSVKSVKTAVAHN